MIRRSILLLALVLLSASHAHAQRTEVRSTAAICSVPTIDRAVVQTFATEAMTLGHGVRGVCSLALYEGVSLNDQNAVTARSLQLRDSKQPGVCHHAQLNQAFAAIGQKPAGWGQTWYCDTHEYNGGRWNTVDELIAHVRTRLADPRLPNHGSSLRRR